jgi:hypothetical protein
LMALDIVGCGEIFWTTPSKLLGLYSEHYGIPRTTPLCATGLRSVPQGLRVRP